MQEPLTKKRLSATVYYLLTGLAFGALAMFPIGAMLGDWQRGGVFTPASLAEIHALILGFMLTVALGVMYQMIPIAFQAPAVPRHVLYWHLPWHMVSVLFITWGFILASWPWVGVGGLSLICATGAFLGHILRSFRQAKNRTIVHRHLLLPIVGLCLVLCIGVIQALAPSAAGPSLVHSHVIVGGYAFWGSLVMVLSYKLIPMFSLSHEYTVSLRRTMVLYTCGYACLLVSAWMAGLRATLVRDLGALGVSLGAAAFAWDLTQILRARKRRRLVRPVRHALVASFQFTAAQILLSAALALHQDALVSSAAVLYALGGLVALMLAYMQKIVPFLWFEYRFSRRPERKSAPSIDDMVPHRLTETSFWIYLAGVMIAVVAPWLDTTLVPWQPFLCWSAGVLMGAGMLLMAVALRTVLTIGGPRPNDEF